MKTKLLFVIFTCFCTVYFTFGQEKKAQFYSKFVIETPISNIQQAEITRAFYEFPGMVTARMDNTTSVFLGIYESSTALNENLIKLWFENHGFVVKCYITELYVEGKMKSISKSNCQ